MPIDEYIQRANEETVLIVQIETPEALDQVEAIAAVEGVDILFLGPGDLSIRLGIPGDMQHSRIADAKQRVAQAAREAGIHWGLPVGSTADAAGALEMGARFICHSADIVIIKTALEGIQDAFGSLGFTFENSLK